MPPMPAIATGTTAAVQLRHRGHRGQGHLRLLLVVVIRLTGAGALMVCCFFCICTLCSRACVGAFGLLGGPAKVCLRLAWMVCTMRYVATRPKENVRQGWRPTRKLNPQRRQ